MPDYERKAQLLRAKAADKAVGPEERAQLLAKAQELEAKYRKPSFTAYDTTITDRSGHAEQPYMFIDGRWMSYTQVQRYFEAMAQTMDLLNRQHAWNKPPDTDTIYEEEYKYDEDYGYDIFEDDEEDEEDD